MDWTLYILFMAVGLGAWGLATRFAKNRTAAAASRGAAGEPTETPAQALHRLAGAIDRFVEGSAHPRELLDQADFQAAVALLGRKDVSFDLLRQYTTGASWPLACASLHVLTERPERDTLCPAMLGQLKQMRPWTVYFALRYFNSLQGRPATGAPLVYAQYWWRDNVIIPDAFREYLERRTKLGDAITFGNALEIAERGDTTNIDWLLYRIDHPSAPVLRAELKRWSELHLDRNYLSTVGRFWTHGQDDDLLVIPDAWRDRLVDACSAILKSVPHRSVLVSGESRVGKTSFLRLVSQLLRDESWTVFESSAAELMAGQIYFGQLEERIRKLVDELSATKKVVWYMPDLLQFAESGRHQGQSASILDQVNQAVNSGKLVLLSEASAAGVVRLFQMRPSLKGAMELLRFEPMNETETATLVREVAGKIADAAEIIVDAKAIDAVLHLSHQYLGSTQLPGITLDLLKRSANHAMSAGEKSLGAEHVFETLSQLSGLPRSILDDNQRLSLEAVREHFAKRVMGQDEAVDAVVDRIAMLKAGLVDPKRPIGVFLFAGPTGTGKTELAKTLAAYLFGSPDRMARLDMSELQTAESTTKILGTGTAETDSLAEKVRKQPFSVVLLDEFEKAHTNAWDLFLQVFDDGRLTDAMGRTVDFRHTMIVLTTNLGATAHAAAAIGFARRQGSYSEEQILQAIGRTFRPEFVNRLDKILVFRPLSRDFMRQILEKELAGVLERRGLRQRDWAVEYEDSAITFLLDKGFTADMGARPLRRAIDEYLLAPLAATMVEHRYPAGDQFLFVRSDGDALQVEFVDPDADAVAPDAGLPVEEDDVPMARAILGATGTEHQLNALAGVRAAIDAKLASATWCDLRDSLSATIGEPDIWQRKDRAKIFSQYELMDRVLEARRTAERLRARLDDSRGKNRRVSRELVTRLALQLHLVSQGIEDAFANAPVDALLRVEPVAVAGGDERSDAVERWCLRLTSMYRAWAERRHMRTREASSTARNQPTILDVTGFGAFRTLSEEAGLHVWEEAEGLRMVARVRVCAGPTEDTPAARTYQNLADLLAHAGDGAVIVRRYRSEPHALVRDARKGWRSGRLAAVLSGDFDLIGTLRD